MTIFRLPIQVCVFLFREQEGGREYLLLHRVPGAGAFWQGVTGAPEEGETLLQGAAREVLEETGFTPARISSPELHLPVPGFRTNGGRRTDLIRRRSSSMFSLAEVDGGDPTLSWEHDAWGWHAPEEAASHAEMAEQRRGAVAV